MRKARRHVILPSFPSTSYRTGREIPHLECEIRSAPFMHKVQDRHRRCTCLRKAPTNVDVAARCRWKTFTEQRHHAPKIISATHYRDVTRRAASTTVTAGSRIVTVDDKAQRVGRSRIAKGRNRNRTAGKQLTANGDSRHAEEGDASQHMINAKRVSVIIEERFRSGRQVHGSEHQPNATGINPAEIDDFLNHRS
jgi:hypothetical protein